jgi:hypothetical protein
MTFDFYAGALFALAVFAAGFFVGWNLREEHKV